MSRTQDLGSISTRLRKIARLSREHRDAPLVSLHHFIDEYWLREAYSRTRKGGAVGVDGDFLIVFANERDARRVSAVLVKRLGRFGLRIAENKTRLVRFSPPSGKVPPSGPGGWSSFDFLGFTHSWAKSRKGRSLFAAAPVDSPPRLRSRVNPTHEEPDAGNPHVRICGGPGG